MKIVGVFFFVFLCVGASQRPDAEAYLSMDYHFQDCLDADIDPYRKVNNKRYPSSHFLMVETVAFPMFFRSRSIIDFEKEGINLTESHGFFDCTDSIGHAKDTLLQTSVVNWKLFQKQLSRKFSSLEHFSKGKISHYHLPRVLDGNTTSVSYCKGNKCRTKIFSQPVFYFSKNQHILELKKLFKFKGFLEKGFNKPLSGFSAYEASFFEKKTE